MQRDNTNSSFGEGDQRNVLVYVVCTGTEHERERFSVKTLSKEITMYVNRRRIIRVEGRHMQAVVTIRWYGYMDMNKINK